LHEWEIVKKSRGARYDALTAALGAEPAAETLECPLCHAMLEDSSLRFMRLHLRKAHPGSNIYDVKFASLVNLLKEYQRGQKAYLNLRNLK
jgi:hypothetical protein